MAKLTLDFESSDEIEEKIKDYFLGQKLITFTWDFEQEVMRRYRKYDIETLIANCKDFATNETSCNNADNLTFADGVASCLGFLESEYYKLKAEALSDD